MLRKALLHQSPKTLIMAHDTPPPPRLIRTQPALAQRAAKYAAILALFAVDPEERNRGFALRTLRDYVLQRRWGGRAAGVLVQAAQLPQQLAHDVLVASKSALVPRCRRVVERLAATAAATGSGGGSLVQEMPEFLLAFLVFLLAHHPDYPTPEVWRCMPRGIGSPVVGAC
jgi:sister-chromatid-cohesion protein PDS5